MSHRIFLISGCAASRLRSTGRVVDALGASCGQREIFHPEAFHAPTLVWPPERAGDASWCAAPVLGKMPPGTVVLHQVRHPLDVVGELHRSGFFRTPSEESRFVQDFLPGTRRGDPLERCMRFWLEWNRMVEEAAASEELRSFRVLVEELDGRLLVEWLAAVGVARSRAAAELELAAERERTSAQRAGLRLQWDDLPAGDLRDEVQAAASRYGYAA